MKVLVRFNSWSGKWVLIAGLIVFVLCLYARAIDSTPVELMRLGYFDLLQMANPRDRISHEKSSVVIINLDEDSLTDLGEWPWDRRVMAQLATNLHNAGAAVMVFDNIFAEDDRMGGDAEFIQAINNKNVVLSMGGYWRITDLPDENPLIKKIGVLRKGQFESRLFFPTVTHLVRNIPKIEAATLGHGVSSLFVDRDGVLRRMPLIINYQGHLYPSLAMETVRISEKQKGILVEMNSAGITNVRLKNGVSFPTDSHGRVWVRFRPGLSSHFVSANDVVANRFDASAIKGKIVIFGSDAVGLGFTATTPTSSAMSSIEIMAQHIESLISGDYLTRHNYVFVQELLFLFVVGLIVLVGLPLLPIRYGVVVFTVGVAGIIGFSWYLYTWEKLLIDASAPVAATTLIFVANMVTRSIQIEKRRKDKVAGV